MLFLSTLSLRRATFWFSESYTNKVISIHALLAESDCHYQGKTRRYSPFLSTLSLRRATRSILFRVASTEISIHALLAESDRGLPPPRTRSGHFYPRSPCGERLTNSTSIDSDEVFLSTLSLRRATCASRIAPSRAESFLSTLSLRRATHGHCAFGHAVDISIHALLAESDQAPRPAG